MAKEKLFRTCVFGGFNKEDVIEYISTLENELERLRASSAGKGQMAPDVIVFDGTESPSDVKNGAGGLKKESPKEEGGEKTDNSEPAQIHAEVNASESSEKMNQKYERCLRELERLTQKLERLDLDYQKLKREKEELERRLKETRQDREQFEKKLEGFRQEREHRDRQLEEYRQEKEQKDRQLEEYRQEKEQIERQLEEYRQEKEQKEHQLEEFKLESDNLNQELEELKRKKTKYEEDYEAVKTVLLNAKIDAEIVVMKARKKAGTMIAEAEMQIEEQRQNFISVLNKYMGIGSNGTLASRFRIEDQMRSVEKAQRELVNIHNYMEDILENLSDDDTEPEKKRFTMDDSGTNKSKPEDGWNGTAEDKFEK